MDAFKSAEIRRMELGGNKKWQAFYDAKTTAERFGESTIKERYDCEVGEEWKERLSADVEGRAFDESGVWEADGGGEEEEGGEGEGGGGESPGCG